MTDLTLKDFSKIATGTYNAGIVDIGTDRRGNATLIKLNHHVHRTSKNNVVLSQAKICEIKEKFISALSNSGVTADKIKEIRNQLGIPESLSYDKDHKIDNFDAKERFLPLTRNAIRAIIDKYATNAINANTLSRKEFRDVLRTKNMSNGNAEKRRKINNASLGSNFNENRVQSAVNALSILSLSGKCLTRAIEDIADSTGRNTTDYDRQNRKTILCNQFTDMCKEALKLLPAGVRESKTFMLCNERIKLVKDDNGMLHAEVGKNPPLRVNLNMDASALMRRMIDTAVNENQTLERNNVSRLMTHVYESELNDLLPADERSSMSREFAIKVCEKMSWQEFGEDVSKAGKFNTEFLMDVASRALKGELVSIDQMESYLEKLARENSTLSDDMKAMLKEVANIPLVKKNKDEEFSVTAPIVGDINKIAENLVQNPVPKEIGHAPENQAEPRPSAADIKNFVADLVFSDDTMVAEAVDSRPDELMRKMLTSPEKIAAFAAIMKDENALNGAADDEITGILKQSFAAIRTIIKTNYEKATGKSFAEAAGKPGFQNELKAFIQDGTKLPATEIAKFNRIINSIASNGCNHIQSFINDVFKIGAGNNANKPGVVATDPYKNKSAEDIKAELKNKSLNDILNSSATDSSSPGQIGLFKQVLSEYFTKMSIAEKKSAFAAALRYAGTFELKNAEGNPLVDPQEIASAKKAAASKFTGAILKGTSPLMQKMLQGIPRSVVGDFADALDDMKSRLAPIPRKIVQAHLMNIIKQSQDADNKIQDITLVKSLGAASVGEAFLCHFKYTDKDGKKQDGDFVVKIMRHDAEERVKKEAEIFTEAAKKLGAGMAKTWQGQLDQYMKEFDFRNEAKNVKEGEKIYSIYEHEDHPSYAIASRVDSMKVADDLVPVSKNVMVATKARGDTLDSKLKIITGELQNLVKGMYKTDPATGKVLWNNKEPIPRDEIKTTAPMGTYGLMRNSVDELEKMSKNITQAAKVWFSEAFLQSGKFHGDFHAGNIMTCPQHATFIDFGNFYEFQNHPEIDKDGNPVFETVEVTQPNGEKVSEQRQKMVDERVEMLRMILGSTLRKPQFFVEGFERLLPRSGREVLEQNRDKVTAIAEAIMTKGDLTNDVAGRMQAVLSELQKLGLEMPPQINCFIQSLVRLQNTMAEMNTIINQTNKLIDNSLKLTAPPPAEPRDDLDVLGKFNDIFLDPKNKEIVKGRPKFIIELQKLSGRVGNKAVPYEEGGEYRQKVRDRLLNSQDPIKTAEELTEIYRKHLTLGVGMEWDNIMSDNLTDDLKALKTEYASAQTPEEKTAALNKFGGSFSSHTGSALVQLEMLHFTVQSMGDKDFEPQSLAGVIMSTLFGAQDAVTQMIVKNFGTADIFTGLHSIGVDDLGMNTFTALLPNKVVDKLIDKAKDMDSDAVFQADIGI